MACQAIVGDRGGLRIGEWLVNGNFTKINLNDLDSLLAKIAIKSRRKKKHKKKIFRWKKEREIYTHRPSTVIVCGNSRILKKYYEKLGSEEENIAEDSREISHVFNMLSIYQQPWRFHQIFFLFSRENFYSLRSRNKNLVMSLHELKF